MKRNYCLQLNCTSDKHNCWKGLADTDPSQRPVQIIVENNMKQSYYSGIIKVKGAIVLQLPARLTQLEDDVQYC